jgi:SAM-dependent methyltransferase
MTANSEEYTDPILYDAENHDFAPDGPFFLDLARQTGGPVLELACGTGRLTIPLAREGIAIAGIDRSPAMLDHARRKSGSLPIRWIEADARHFDLGASFSLIFASPVTFQHMLDRPDQEAFLASVHHHLRPDGLFAFSLLFPKPSHMVDDDQEQEWFSYTAADGRQVAVSGIDHYDPVRQVKTETAIRRWRDDQGRPVEARAPLSLRLIFPQEIEALLHYNGFAVVERYGDFHRAPLTARSQEIVLVCHKRSPESL